MTTQSDFEDLISTLEDNLQAMGVTDAEFDSTTGIMGLIARILDIEPTFALSDVSMNLTLSIPSIANINVPVTLSATLIGSYDDTQTSNVDLLTAEMRGATIEFYNGNTLIGTAITNENGIATLEYTPLTTGTHVITAIFNGTDIWENATSNTAYLEVESLTITSSSNIVSVGDTITLTATYLDSSGLPVEDESIDFIDCSDDSIIGTATTDSNGECSVSYSVKDTNPLNIKAICGSVESSSITLKIYRFFDETSSNNVGLYTVSSSLSFNYDSSLNAYKITTNSASENFNVVSLTNELFPNECTVEYDLYMSNVNTQNVQCVGGLMNSNNNMKLVARYVKNTNVFSVLKSSTYSNRQDVVGTSVGLSYNTWYTVSITYNGDDITAIIKQGDNILATITTTYSALDNTANKLVFGMYCANRGGFVSYIKNIKVILL